MMNTNTVRILKALSSDHYLCLGRLDTALAGTLEVKFLSCKLLELHCSYIGIQNEILQMMQTNNDLDI